MISKLRYITSTPQAAIYMKNVPAYPFFIPLVLFFSLTISTPSWARVSGLCSNCHTMHNSQSNITLSADGPNATLLTSDCIGCHSSGTSSTYYELGGCKIPVVLFTGGDEPTEYLAGGNFYWVKEGLGGDDSKGHNAFLGEDDDMLHGAPGGGSCGTNSCHENLSQPYEDANSSMNGKYGCTGCHMSAKHHAVDHENGVSGLVDKNGGYYRFLANHFANGVTGYEDGLWEAGLHDGTDHQGSTVHNEYLGDSSGNTITSYCTACHGLFHTQQDADDLWIRHPSDAIIPDEGEYQFCTTYDPLSPVARAVLPTEPSGAVVPSSDMVMCLSCHRPHGSPYPDMLRWDYTRRLSENNS